MQQQPLFVETPGQVLLDLAVDGITDLNDFEKRKLARELAVLVFYHARKQPCLSG